MLKEIEESIAAYLDAKLSGVSRISIDEAHSVQTLKLPGVDVITGDGTFHKVTMQQYKYKPSVFVIVTFQNLRSVQERRAKAYPIIEAIIALLIGKQFDLKIDPLVPKNGNHITEKAEAEEGKIVFQIEFETGFIITTQSDDEVTDLLRIGLNYYLQDPADDTVDATDLVTCTGE